MFPHNYGHPVKSEKRYTTINCRRTRYNNSYVVGDFTSLPSDYRINTSFRIVSLAGITVTEDKYTPLRFAPIEMNANNVRSSSLKWVIDSTLSNRVPWSLIAKNVSNTLNGHVVEGNTVSLILAVFVFKLPSSQAYSTLGNRCLQLQIGPVL